MQVNQKFSSGERSSEFINGNTSVHSVQSVDAIVGKAWTFAGLQGSRRDILRYGSLGIAVSCLLFVVTNWKAMQYASPKGLMNAFFGSSNTILGQNAGKPQSTRVQQLKDYIANIEERQDAQYVPEFPSKLDWLNAAPLKFYKDLEGKIVLLDFWTYCCINCMHVLPDLEYLEKKYSGMPLVVVGVHSAKFDNEKDLDAIRNAVLRYNIAHPVVNDGDMNLWRELGINSWPTFVIVGPTGKLIGQISGEGHQKDLDDVIEAALQFYGERNLLNSKKISLALEKDKDTRLLKSPLKFPGKLDVDALNNRLFISDSNHNRIVVTDLDGNFMSQIGSTGEPGLQDGPFDVATFTRPQGVSYNPKKNVLYVADTENHALREIDFVNEVVRTLAGNGTKGSDYVGGERGTRQVLNSPWDVCYVPKDNKIYIAMAGQHQIWQHRTSDGVTMVFSGDGYERNMNGSTSTNTSYAQPSGLAVSPDQKELYVADSESSSIRVVDLKTGGSSLLAGGDPFFADNLFKFGDHDGVGADVLLQHPLGVFCGLDGQVYIADSYNHKIKKLDPTSKKVVTVAGSGTAGYKNASALVAQLSEPSGIIEVGTGKFLVADTNNNAIRCLDLTNGALQTFELKGVPLPSPRSKSPKRLRRRQASDSESVHYDGGSSKEGDLYLMIAVPDGYHLSKEARSLFDVEVEPQDAIVIEPLNGLLDLEGYAKIHFQRMSSSSTTGKISCKVYYCKEDEICLYQPVTFDVAFQQVSPDSAPAELKLSFTVTPKVSQDQLILTT